MTPNDAYWLGFRAGIHGLEPHFEGPDHHWAYERGWVLGRFEYREQRKEQLNDEQQAPSPAR